MPRGNSTLPSKTACWNRSQAFAIKRNGKPNRNSISKLQREREQTIASMQRQIEAVKRKAEQGSQQCQGEVQEPELESVLAAKFPADLVEPVPKGEFGGDIVHRVLNHAGQTCGTLLWESKRIKNWSDGWIAKLRQAGDGQYTKMGMVYEYLTGPRFRNRIEAMVEKFTDMQEDLDKERKTMTRLWAKREEQIH